MTATATRKRTKQHKEDEAQARALKAFDAIPPASDGDRPDTLKAESPDDAGSPSIDDIDPADEPTKIGPDVEKIVAEATANGSDPEDEHRKAKAFDEAAQIEKQAAQAEAEWEEAKEIASEKKKAYDNLVVKLRKVISQTSNPAAMPLFDGKAAAAGEKADDGPTQEVNPPDDAWRNMPLREALPELSKTIHDKLEGAQLFTMGELANWTAENGGRRRLTDIAGIGSAASGKIEEATMAFWKRQSVKMTPANQVAKNPPEEYLCRVLPWDIGLIDEQPADVSKFQTIGDLEKYAASVGLSIFDTLRNMGLSSINADKVLGWLDEERKDAARE